MNKVDQSITVSNNRDLPIKTNRFNEMCSTIRRTLNNKTREIHVYNAMAVPARTYGSGM
jgi:hypothetical protein